MLKLELEFSFLSYNLKGSMCVCVRAEFLDIVTAHFVLNLDDVSQFFIHMITHITPKCFNQIFFITATLIGSIEFYHFIPDLLNQEKQLLDY